MTQGDGPAGGWLPPSAPGAGSPVSPPRAAPAPRWAPPGGPAAQTWQTDPTATVPPAGPSAGRLELAGFGERAGAATVDFVVRLGIIALGVGAGALVVAAGGEVELWLILGGALGYALSILLYAPLMLARTDGRTLGHRATGTRIVMADGSRMTGGKAFIREVLVKFLLLEAFGNFLISIPTLVNYLMPLWDEGNEALHDKICGTRVVLDR